MLSHTEEGVTEPLGRAQELSAPPVRALGDSPTGTVNAPCWGFQVDYTSLRVVTQNSPATVFATSRSFHRSLVLSCSFPSTWSVSRELEVTSQIGSRVRLLVRTLMIHINILFIVIEDVTDTYQKLFALS